MDEEFLSDRRVLLTGATGFVGGALYPELRRHGYRVRCATRDPVAAAARLPGRDWVRMDAAAPGSVRAALEGMNGAYYLVHGMAGGHGYPERERGAAEVFRDAACAARVGRIVYLGGVLPPHAASRHLESRRETGAILRAGPVPVVELRCSMIVGEGSASWRICRDLAARVPLLLLPRWLQSRTQPVAIVDVVRALRVALEIPLSRSFVADLPGPETLTGEEILLRIAALRGTRPRVAHVPLLTPRLSGLWLRVVSGADYAVARELVTGLTQDLLSTESSFWRWMTDPPTPFDDAVRAALAAEHPTAPERLIEGLMRRLARRTTS